MGVLQEFKQHELYEKFMAGVNAGLQDYRNQFPNDKVELVEENESMFVLINGVRTNEIEFESLLKG